MDSRIKDKVAMVTGGAGGIGEATVRLLADEGALVAILDRDSQRAARLADELNDRLNSGGTPRVLPVDVDLISDVACREAVQTVHEHFQRLDIVVNNAGINDTVNIDRPLDAFAESLRKNLFHVYSITHYSIPQLAANHGSIVNVTSKVADTGQGGTSGYAAAKGAINALTREWAVELAPRGIRVNAVAPAEVLTPMYEQWLAGREHVRKNVEDMIPLENRFTTAEEIAATIVFLASPLSSHTTGQILHPDGGYVHLDRAVRR